MNDERQTLLGVTGSILLAIIVFMAVRVLVFGDQPNGQWAVERILGANWLAITMIATRYHRLPLDRRLPAPHAIGLGGLQLIMISWLVISAPASAERRWFAVLAPALLAIPGVYLMVMGTRAIRATELEARE